MYCVVWGLVYLIFVVSYTAVFSARWQWQHGTDLGAGAVQQVEEDAPDAARDVAMPNTEVVIAVGLELAVVPAK